jgi:prolyl-tRNA synthetase
MAIDEIIKMQPDEAEDQEEQGEGERDKEQARWYTDTILQSELADYAPVRGCMTIRPYGYALWENIQQALDRMLKETGHQNAYFPLFIPESFMNKEKEHVEGFAPECAVVTHGGGKKLEEPLMVRPTSETIINYSYAKWVQSWRDLPILINQWANVVRWEKRTRLFLRTTEFLWQEGHTAHATAAEAEAEALKILEIYRILAEDYLALPVLTGTKTVRERFAGAVQTYCIEAYMRDGKALQAGTSHFLGQNFAKAFDIKFQNQDGNQEYAWQTSWGVSTRLIGALVMGHGDAKGLVLPPRIAPLQVVIVPIFKTAEEQAIVMAKCDEIFNALKGKFRMHLDARDNYTPGFKFNYWEQKGVPVRLNIGPKDVANDVVEVVRRDTGEKMRGVKQAGLTEEIEKLLAIIQQSMYDSALAKRKNDTFTASTYDEFKTLLADKHCFVEAFWDGTSKDEERVKDETKATVRVIPLQASGEEGPCMLTGRVTNQKVVFARAY